MVATLSGLRAGTSSRLTKPERVMQPMIVSANSRNIFPSMSGINNMGKKTASRETVMESMVKATSVAPS